MTNKSIDTLRQKRIAAVHDFSGLGKCSLTVALPVICAAGVECACIPTALLSTHTGEFRDFTFHDLSSQMEPIAEHWHREGCSFDGIYSGYLASPGQEALLEKVIDCLSDEETLVIVDPVMADSGEYYSGFDEEMCSSFRRLCAKADIITPNITEAAFLTGLPYREGDHERAYIDDLFDGLATLGADIAIITGVHACHGQVGAAARDMATGEEFISQRLKYSGVFYGTGDLMTSALAALLVSGAGLSDALDISVSLVSESIERTVRRNTPRRFGVDFEGALLNFAQRAAGIGDLSI